MKEVIKKAVKWYFEMASKTYAWTPTGMYPNNRGLMD
jgi:hypothetical protein